MHLIPYYDKKTGKINTRLGPENDFSVLSLLKYLPKKYIEKVMNESEENDIEE